MSPPRIIEEMRLLYDSFGTEMVWFEEDLFTVNRKRVLDFCELMEKELCFPSLKAPWVGF